MFWIDGVFVGWPSQLSGAQGTNGNVPHFGRFMFLWNNVRAPAVDGRRKISHSWPPPHSGPQFGHTWLWDGIFSCRHDLWQVYHHGICKLLHIIPCQSWSHKGSVVILEDGVGPWLWMCGITLVGECWNNIWKYILPEKERKKSFSSQ